VTGIVIGPSLTVHVAPHGEPSPPDVARIAIGVADPVLARALSTSIAGAIAGVFAATRGADAAIGDAAMAIGGDGPAPTVRLRSRKRLAQVASRLGGAIAIVPVTAKNARHLVALVDGIRAAGAVGVQLVWDGAVPPRAEVERHVFAVLERARATPGEPPVVVAATEAPVTALELLIAHRSRRKDEPR
jgi:hypothetical protein